MDLRDSLVNDFPHIGETVVATAALIDTVSHLSDEDVRAPSLLPGWTRAHVITHLARNADAMANVLRGAEAGEVRPQYSSLEKRDADIEAGSGRAAASLLQDLVAACGRWEHAANGVHVVRRDALGARLPGGPTYPVHKIGMFRRTEVEVHHADLDTGYSAADWPAEFVAALMARRCKELDRSGVVLRWTATDSGETWAAGEGGPVVRGTATDILWWLLGRGGSEGLACSDGRLPSIGRWT